MADPIKPTTMLTEHDALVEQALQSIATRFNLRVADVQFVEQEITSIRTTDAARIAALTARIQWLCEQMEAVLAQVPHCARTDTVSPVNGSRPYTVVLFRGHRIEFRGRNEFDASDTGTDRAAAFAQAINGALADTARAALAALKGQNQ